jgi:hypothetical protein
MTCSRLVNLIHASLGCNKNPKESGQTWNQISELDAIDELYERILALILISDDHGPIGGSRPHGRSGFPRQPQLRRPGGDGSARFISYSMNDVLPQMCTREGGEVVVQDF